MAGDWLKLHRSILDSELFADDWLTRLWIWCLCRANYSNGRFRGEPIERGQFVTGRNSASAELQVSPSKWYRGIERLQQLGCIKTEANSNWTTITVCKYDTYQNGSDEGEQQSDSERTSGDTTSGQAVIQPADTIEERNNSKKGRREEGKKVSAGANQNHANDPRETWLTPYCQTWEEVFGGEMSIGPACKPLRKLEKQHGPEEVARRWRKYCEANQGQGEFASATKFATTFGQWTAEHRNGKPQTLFRGLQQFVAEAEGRMT